MAKRRTAKQMAGFKKMQAGLKKYRKKMGIGKKKRRSNPKKKRKKVVKRRVVRKKVTKRRVVRKSNPAKQQYYIKQGTTKYFNGGGFSNSKSNAVYFNSYSQAVKITNALVKATGKAASINSTVKKKR